MLIQQVGHLAYMQPTWILFPEPYLVPQACHERFLYSELGENLDHGLIWAQNTNKTVRMTKI